MSIEFTTQDYFDDMSLSDDEYRNEGSYSALSYGNYHESSKAGEV